MGSGDPSGLQNRRELASLALVSSTLTRFRQFCFTSNPRRRVRGLYRHHLFYLETDSHTLPPTAIVPPSDHGHIRSPHCRKECAAHFAQRYLASGWKSALRLPPQSSSGVRDCSAQPRNSAGYEVVIPVSLRQNPHWLGILSEFCKTGIPPRDE